MTSIDRRNFLKIISITTIGAATLGVSAIASACSSEKQSSDVVDFVALRVSSDTYMSDVKQRVAFSVFNQKREVVADGNVNITLTSPSGKKQLFKNIAVRNKEIPNKGIYTFPAKLNEAGIWKLTLDFKGEPLDLNLAVTEKNVAPAIGSQCPSTITPTDAAALDAEILCTRYEGNCGLHKHSLDELLKTKKPFVILFATPARCQTSYCGPVLDMTRDVEKTTSIPTIHVEIYKNETSNDTLEAVNTFNLATEPWMFGVTSEGKIDWRLDGAFDKSEIEELYKRLK